MTFAHGDLLHVYNRGNNKQQIFFNEENYYFFREKIKKHVAPACDIIAYCLMPNHFHLLLHINEVSCEPCTIGNLKTTWLQNNIRILQSSYAAAINNQFKRTGSLFQQRAKYKLLTSSDIHSKTYAEVCYHYIHQNPLKAGLINKMEDWKFSSFNEYAFGTEGICNLELATAIFNIDQHKFYEISYRSLDSNLTSRIF
ncbi:MAG: transposase [Bacteroidota bacterium]